MSNSLEQFAKDFKGLDKLSLEGIDVLIPGAAISAPGFDDATGVHDIKYYDQAFNINVIGAMKLYKSNIALMFHWK